MKKRISQIGQESGQKFKEYESDMTKYVRTRRLIAGLIGITFVIVGSLLANYFLGSGFIIGGTLCIASASIHWWYKLSNTARFLIIVFALFLLFTIGYLLVRHKQKKI